MRLERSLFGSGLAALALVLAGAAACSDGDPAGPGAGGPGGDDAGEAGADDGADGPEAPFYPDPPSVYVAKVKNVLVGLPATDDEVKAVVADPNAFGGLVDGWMNLPEYETKMRRFFDLAFQQTQITPADFGDMLNPGQLQLDPNRVTSPLLLQNVQESFARTMLDPSMKGQPFTQAMSTPTFAMTTALKVFYTLLDTWEIDDTGKLDDKFADANPGAVITVEASKGTIPFADSADPSKPNYLHFYNPDVANLGGGAACQTDPITYPVRSNTLYYILLGILPARKLADGTQCPGTGGLSAATGQLTLDDFGDWKMTTVRQPNPGEATTRFFDLDKLHSTNELVLALPRVGFFSTPAFFANWQTNDSNQMRVTINQTLIVATGAQVDGTDPTVPTSTPGLDSTHAGAAECSVCHQLLDPTRSILSATYSWNYHTQKDTTFSSQKGLFAFQGVQAPVNSVADLGNTLASHPLVAQAWAQKLCFYVNSEPCAASDQELARIVSVFKSSSYSWRALVKELVTSPITTHASRTTTASQNGEVIAVSRLDHICAAWNARLGFADICALDATQKPIIAVNGRNIVSGLPSDGYARGSVAPALPNEPTLFHRAGIENLCESIATLLIDNPKPPPGAKTWASAQGDAAIPEFVSLIAGLPPSDPRSGPMLDVLKTHFATTKTQDGVTATDALRSTFTLACMAPTAVAIGL